MTVWGGYPAPIQIHDMDGIMEQLTREEMIRRILEIAAQLPAEDVAAAVSKVKTSPVG